MGALAIIILIIFGILMTRGWIHGLLRMVLAVIAIVVVMVLVTVATPYVRDYIKENTSIYTTIQEKCSDKIQEKLEESLEANAEASLEDMSLPQQVTAYVVGSGESMLEESGIYETVGTKVANWTLTGGCYVVMFLIGMIVIAVVKHMAKRANDVPVLGKINRFLGLILGGGEAYLLVCVIFMVIALSSGSELGQTCTESIRDNSALNFLYQHNILLNFLKME